MLTFEPQQLESFAREAFVLRMGDVLRTAAAALPGDDVAVDPQEIEQAMQQARMHGFSEERDCARWVLCAWAFGQDFHRRLPAFAALLAERETPPSYKALAMEVMLRAAFAALAGHSGAVP